MPKFCRQLVLVAVVSLAAYIDIVIGVTDVHAQETEETVAESNYQGNYEGNYEGNFVLKEGDRLPRSKASEVYHKQISEILAEEDFGYYETVEAWRFKDKDVEADEEDEGKEWDFFPDWLKDFFELDSSSKVGFGFILELLLWVAVAAGILWLIYNYREQLRTVFGGSSESSKPELPVSLFGIDLEHNKLPENIVATAVDHWRENRRREAIALLLSAS